MQTVGTRAQVWHGTAKKTPGGLTKINLMKNKHGRIVSKRKHASGKRTIKHLKSLGYVAKKGEFKLFHKGHKGHSRKMRGGTGAPMGMGIQGTPTGNAMAGISQPLPVSTPGQIATGLMGKKGGRRSRKMRGGMTYGGPLSPHSYDGQGQGTSGVALQFVAGNAG
jgi:hypothetical protein